MTSRVKSIIIGILAYPGVSMAAVWGMKEFFEIAGNLTKKESLKFEILIFEDCQKIMDNLNFLILPPALEDYYYLNPEEELKELVVKLYNKGTVLCSACAGAFILTKSIYLENKKITTHWMLVDKFRKVFPNVKLNEDKILIDEGRVLTAGGMMSWLDLCFAILQKFTGNQTANELSRILVADGGYREQKYYKRFMPDFNHHDEEIKLVQKLIHENFNKILSVEELASKVGLTKQTLQRRFKETTGKTVNKYIQYCRINKACEMLLSTNQTFENITFLIGYENSSTAGKLFKRITGLRPIEFRKRFKLNFTK